MQTIATELAAVAQPRSDEIDAYERLLTDAMAGEGLLFVREDMVDAAWAVVDPILDNAVPINAYCSGTWGPPEAERLMRDLGGWRNPNRMRATSPTVRRAAGSWKKTSRRKGSFNWWSSATAADMRDR